MNTKLSHVALLVNSVEASAAFLKSRGIKTGNPEVFESEGTKEVYVGSYGAQSGLLLLIEAQSEGPYKRAFMKRGASLHHLAIDVLNIEDFSREAQKVGWKLHPISETTASYKTIWLFLKGIPTLIEVQQKKELPSKPMKISKVELPIKEAQLTLFEAIGLGEVVSQGNETLLTLDGRKLNFNQVACLK